MDLRDKEADLRKEMDMLKNQRADNWREINRLKDANDAKSKEGQDQAERIKDIDYQLARTSQRIEETQKLVDARNYDLRNK